MNAQDTYILTIFGLLTIAGQIISIFLIFLLISTFITKNNSVKKITSFFSSNATAFALLVTAGATLGSLYSSEIAGLAPCKLCWLQRIFMFPLPVLLVVSLITNDAKVKKYVLPLAFIGISIAVYHILLQMYPNVLQCGDELVSCAEEQVKLFGYITVPVMSATAFLLAILFMLFSQSKKS